MSRIVFVLGAGASAHCGTPLMDNFLEVAQDLMRMGEVDEVKEDFKNVFDAIGNLHAIQSKAKINTYNIEDVYAAFEMGKLLGRLPGIGENTKIEKLTASIRKVISYTLERTTKLPNDSDNRPHPSITYFHFVNIIKKLMEAGKDCSIMTFNYDLGFDYSLQYNNISVDYCLNDLHTANKVSIPYLKLHGSINWGRCSSSGCTKVNSIGELRRDIYESYSTIPVISKLKSVKCGYCGKALEEDPFIVPPTWNKTAYHEQIEVVWKRAALELKDAENIFVLGYSFPETDMFFRYLFALGVDMRTVFRGFYVYNPDPSAEERFQNLLGSGVEQRFHFYEAHFEEAIRQPITVKIGQKIYPTIKEILSIA